MSLERELAHKYIEKVSAGESATNQEIAYWDYELHVRYLKEKKEKYNLLLNNLVKAIHREERENY